MKVLITQSMFFPWPGFFELFSAADIVVHYDDVPFSKGSFTNRIQIKTVNGSKWMTVPLSKFPLGTPIDSVKYLPTHLWQAKHEALAMQSFRSSPFAHEALELMQSVCSQEFPSIGHLSRASMLAVADYYGLLGGKQILDSRNLDVHGSGSQRVLQIVKKVGGTEYITAHGASNYLDHPSFEKDGIEVNYIEYQSLPYSQPWGPFTPYVSTLDLIANMGSRGVDYINSKLVNWRDFLN